MTDEVYRLVRTLHYEADRNDAEAPSCPKTLRDAAELLMKQQARIVELEARLDELRKTKGIA